MYFVILLSQISLNTYFYAMNKLRFLFTYNIFKFFQCKSKITSALVLSICDLREYKLLNNALFA